MLPLNFTKARNYFPHPKKEQGNIRSGFPLSGLLFVIGFELLARSIKLDNLIKRITIGEKEIKISMYEDDTTVFVRDLDSITHLLNMLEKFASISGLQVNTSETDALWLAFGKTDKTLLSISIIHKILFVHWAFSSHTTSPKRTN